VIPNLIPCKVVSASAASAAASGLTYTVDMQLNGGVVRQSGIKPSTNRPPDTIDTLAAAVGSWFLAYESSPGNYVYLLQEFPDFAACEGGA